MENTIEFPLTAFVNKATAEMEKFPIEDQIEILRNIKNYVVGQIKDEITHHITACKEYEDYLQVAQSV